MILEPIIREGETYPLARDLSEAAAKGYWFSPAHSVRLACDERSGDVLGTYYLKANAGGGGRHVCNCGYAVSPVARGHGVARRMCEDSQERARAQGFRAMQFNFVVATNTAAVYLWTSCGFATVGRLPGAFFSPSVADYVDAIVMFKTLTTSA